MDDEHESFEDDDETESINPSSPEPERGAAPVSGLDVSSEEHVNDLILPTKLPFKRKSGLTHQGKKIYWKRVKHILMAEKENPPPDHMRPLYMDIIAPKSKYPAKKYCDLTGFEARYVDPKTDLQYTSADQFQIIRTLPRERVEAFLALRHAAHVLR